MAGVVWGQQSVQQEGRGTLLCDQKGWQSLLVAEKVTAARCLPAGPALCEADSEGSFYPKNWLL